MFGLELLNKVVCMISYYNREVVHEELTEHMKILENSLMRNTYFIQNTNIWFAAVSFISLSLRRCIIFQLIFIFAMVACVFLCLVISGIAETHLSGRISSNVTSKEFILRLCLQSFIFKWNGNPNLKIIFCQNKFYSICI